ncbi:MAG TPA: FtsQ-type POTRA domain-containing protein [Pyrinomonadaceae bacterium]|nr:FtsQ-type POTRA domain-containing protein [Pyrinomonadaceae bacterium]
MREQVIGQKVGNRTGLSGQRRSGAVTQKPARRETPNVSLATRARALLGFLPAFLKLALAIIIGVVCFAGYRAAASASFFQLRKIEVQGTSRVQPSEVQAVIKQSVEKTGVWKADLAEINGRLVRLPWVRSAVITRVLPDGIRVRITERVPRAVARTATGRFRWIDEEAALLGEMQPGDDIPAFFLRGLSDEDSDSARSENRERVQKFLELQSDWDAAGISERVSELNVMDLRDVRAQLAGDNSQIEVRLGSRDQGERLKKALQALDSRDDVPNATRISYIDMSLGNGKAIVGLTSGAHATADAASAAASNSETVPNETAVANALPAPAEATREKQPTKNATTPSHARSSSDNQRLIDRNKKDRNDRNAKPEKKTDKSKTAARRKP